MIIDSHTHIGSISQFHLPEQMLLDSMEKYSIDLAIVSNLEGNEFDSERKLIDPQISQFNVNEKVVRLRNRSIDRIKGLYWIKPHTEDFDSSVEEYLIKNKDTFCGFKIHPFHSHCSPLDDRLFPWYILAEKLNFPIVVHSSDDEYSHPELLFRTAQKYTNLTFVMVHLGLGTDNMDAIEYVKIQDNLIGETTWVNADNAFKAVKVCGSRKIMFGTDAPIAGPDTYAEYFELMRRFKLCLTTEEFDNVFYRNALRVFSL
ncbi:amidohydrolase family protein [bacterium]|nr:amidohydrolase family protein [bacterium]